MSLSKIKFMLVNFPFSEELKVLFKLINKDDELRLVGGCVRDFLYAQIFTSALKKEITDIDLACKFLPEITTKILQNAKIKTIPTGIKHGTITAIINNKTFEITTLRQDVKNFGRHAQIKFVDDFFEDAKRRDFTINAMSISAQGQLFDYFGGFEDLKNQKVHFIGDAAERINEDYLRILRFFRFSCFYSNEIDKSALKETVRLKENLCSLSAERINSEITKIINCPNSKRVLEILSLMQKHKILEKILLFPNFDLSILPNLLSLEEKLEQTPHYLLKFAALIYSRQEHVQEISNHLKFSNKEKKYLSDLLQLAKKVNLQLRKTDLIKILFDFEKDLVSDALKLNYIVNLQEENLAKFKQMHDFINSSQLPNFILNGNDLLKLGFKGQDIGLSLQKLRDVWIESGFKINKEKLLKLIQK